MLATARLTILAAATVVSVSGVADALKPNTVYAFDRYVRLTEQRIQGELGGSQPLLWIDRQPADARPALLSRLEKGEVISEKLETRDQGKQSTRSVHGAGSSARTAKAMRVTFWLASTSMISTM